MASGHPWPGTVVRVQTRHGTVLSIVKGGAAREAHAIPGSVIVYVPGAGDIFGGLRSIVDPDPICSGCGTSSWYWVGEHPLHPDAIQCGACTPPEVSHADREATFDDAVDAIAARWPGFADDLRSLRPDYLILDWPKLQQVTFLLWILAVAGRPDHEPRLPLDPN